MLTSEKLYLEMLKNQSTELYNLALEAGIDLLIESTGSYLMNYDYKLVEKENRKPFSELCATHNQKIHSLIKSQMIDYVGLSNHPKAENAWQFAYNNHHSEGYSAVLDELEALAELIL